MSNSCSSRDPRLPPRPQLSPSFKKVCRCQVVDKLLHGSFFHLIFILSFLFASACLSFPLLCRNLLSSPHFLWYFLTYPQLTRIYILLFSFCSEFEQSVVPWTDDSLVPLCPDCGHHFGILRRRHHCRLCGSVLCVDCVHAVPVEACRKLRGGGMDRNKGTVFSPS